MAQARFYSSLTKRTTTTADPGTSGTTLTVADTSSFSVLDSTFPYALLINWGQGDQEIVNVTARPSGTTFTIVRAQDGTTGQAHAIGATVDHGVSARDFNDAGAHVGASSGVHGVTGSVVGTTDTQTMTNKTVLFVVNSYSANHTATATESVILVDASGASRTITLPTASGVAGQSYTIKRTDSTTANSVTIATTSSQTIDGATTYTKLWAQYTYIQVVSDGSNWAIIDGSSIPEPWQTYTLASGVAQGSGNGVNGFFYRRCMDNSLDCAWDIKCNATTGAIGSSALPAAYRPATEHNIASSEYSVTTLTNGLPHLDFLATGVINLQAITSTSMNLCGTAKVYLDK